MEQIKIKGQPVKEFSYHGNHRGRRIHSLPEGAAKYNFADSTENLAPITALYNKLSAFHTNQPLSDLRDEERRFLQHAMSALHPQRYRSWVWFSTDHPNFGRMKKDNSSALAMLRLEKIRLENNAARASAFLNRSPGAANISFDNPKP